MPTLEYYFEDNKFGYHWINGVLGFNMLLKVKLYGKEQRFIQPPIGHPSTPKKPQRK